MNLVQKSITLEVAEADEQIVGGFISTNNRDRHGDIVEPDGCDTSQLQMLLEGHDHDKPVGRLIDVERRPEGVYARFKVIADDCWQKVKAGLYPAFSIGFIPKTAEPLKDGGWLYKAVEVIETSLVAIPSNRESQIVEVRSALEGNKMSEVATAPSEGINVKVAPAVHTKEHKYSLKRVMSQVLEQRHIDGVEGEFDQELRAKQPWREYGGAAVPVEMIFLNDEQRAAITKASGVVNPTNLEPLTGEDYRDELFTLIDEAIGKQLLSGQLGVRTLTGLREQTIRIPRQDAMMSAGHVALDTDLPDSSDPTFSNTTMTPKLVGSVAQLQLSSILAQHPRVGTDFIGSELRRALIQEVERVFLAGDTATNPAEPNGLDKLADDTDGLTLGVSTPLSDLNACIAAYVDYLQEWPSDVKWVLPLEYLQALEVIPAFTGSQKDARQAFMDKGMDARIGLNLTDGNGFFGLFQYMVHGIWQGIDVSLNPYADSVFAKKATLLRVSMMHDYQIIDPKRIRKVTVTTA